MTKFTYYPGCSSQASAAHLDKSLRSTFERLGHSLNYIEDWNCCGASVGHIHTGHLMNSALSARNLALAQEQGGAADVVSPCAACYLNTHYVNESIRGSEKLKDQLNEALGAAGKSYDGSLHVRHACEVLVTDVGKDKLAEAVRKPLTGLKVAGWVGCQTVRPFANTERGNNFDSYDQPTFLDDFITATGAEAVPFENKTACCGGSVSVMDVNKSIHLMKRILDEAAAAGADVVATPCPLCQTNLEMYQTLINTRYGTTFNIPVVFYSQLLAVAFGLDPYEAAGLDQNIIRSEKLEAMGGAVGA
ncbi:MAG: CoB--CoM heterodisulfide reductase iron-sulfur subunit B family protein [Alphaproteobacteria bacterium]|nr:CoB--CoM heterodisulfide reductase iron-sulfur subunit B family protein [Alphaproteobacteria bacterium]